MAACLQAICLYYLITLPIFQDNLLFSRKATLSSSSLRELEKDKTILFLDKIFDLLTKSCPVF